MSSGQRHAAVAAAAADASSSGGGGSGGILHDMVKSTMALLPSHECGNYFHGGHNYDGSYGSRATATHEK